MCRLYDFLLGMSCLILLYVLKVSLRLQTFGLSQLRFLRRCSVAENSNESAQSKCNSIVRFNLIHHGLMPRAQLFQRPLQYHSLNSYSSIPTFWAYVLRTKVQLIRKKELPKSSQYNRSTNSLRCFVLIYANLHARFILRVSFVINTCLCVSVCARVVVESESKRCEVEKSKQLSR